EHTHRAERGRRPSAPSRTRGRNPPGVGADRPWPVPAAPHPREFPWPGAWLNVHPAARFGRKVDRSRSQREQRMGLTVVKNATCTFCGCVCDDIELHADGERIVKTRAACSLGESWFRHHTAERLFPDALIDGKPATVDEAVEAAAEYLHRANMPLVYGLSNVT